MQKFFILIQMLTMGTGCNGLFMMILMCVPYQFMKQDVIYFRVREILMNGGKGKDMVFLLIFQLMPLQRTNPGLQCYRTAVIEIAAYFKPDVIFTQNGADSHYWDPLTHLSATMKIYKEIPKLAHEIAHQYCEGRWIAVGGGGYDIWRVVPRAWSYIWLEMTENKAEFDQLPQDMAGQMAGESSSSTSANMDG